MGTTKQRGRRTEKKEREQNHDLERSEVTSNKGQSELGTTFFGLVDSAEIEYFKQAESNLNINAFESDEERQGFITSVLEEAKGKELKLVTNQICSKLMERLILFGTDAQVKHIFIQFSNHFVALCNHKYSSHVLETLLVRVAALVEKEMVADPGDEIDPEEMTESDDFVTMESLFLGMLNEYKGYIKIMMDHQYASHVLRILILILSSKELPSTTTANSTLRSKKSKIARKMIEIKDNADFDRSYQVPQSFKDELKQICNIVGEGMDKEQMRNLAIHKIASPVLQLLIQVEGIVDQDRSLWHSVFEKDEKIAQEEAFVEYLLSDSVGSHFLENTIKNGGARMRYIERLYKLYIKDRVLKLTRRATTGVYIIQALLFRLKPIEVEYIMDQIVPELANLVSISENKNIDIARSLIDASITRGNYRREEIIEQFFKKFAPNYDAESQNNSSEFLENVLQLSSSTLGNTKDDWPTAEERRRALFLEKLIQYDSRFLICAWNNFLALPIKRFIQMCYHGVFCHVIEVSLIVPPGEAKNITILRKRVLNLFQNEIINLACNSYGSHIVDKLWEFTIFLPMYKDRIATELMSDSHKVKESNYGRLVWKNWSMELFVRKKYDWKSLVKQQEQESTDQSREKRPIDIKMEKLAQNKANEKSNHSGVKRNEMDAIFSSKKQKLHDLRRR